MVSVVRVGYAFGISILFENCVVQPYIANFLLLIAIKKPMCSIESAFNVFTVDEDRIWTRSGAREPPPSKFLVKPSGSLESPLSHRLNQPSFNSNFPENGETADSTNGCIAMVRGTSYDRHTLLYDQVH
jgi:hypothetical protein